MGDLPVLACGHVHSEVHRADAADDLQAAEIVVADGSAVRSGDEPWTKRDGLCGEGGLGRPAGQGPSRGVVDIGGRCRASREPDEVVLDLVFKPAHPDVVAGSADAPGHEGIEDERALVEDLAGPRSVP
jgi:hypothetical protein